MSGLSIDVSHLHDRLKKVTLTPNGLLHLAEKGHFICISDADIKDKSKANTLAKGLVFLQITWTILQCLSRKVVGLPLSILEVHILVHAGCALIMYILWFNKPLDVEEPITVASDISDEIIALMLIQTHNLGTQPNGNLVPPAGFLPARTIGSRSSIWPADRASEAAYLMFDPRATNNPASCQEALGDVGNHAQLSSNQSGSPTNQAPAISGGQDAVQLDLAPATPCTDLEINSSNATTVSRGNLSTTMNELQPTLNIQTGTFRNPDSLSSPTLANNTNHLNLRDVSSTPTSQAGGIINYDRTSYCPSSQPPVGVKIQATISTGSFLSGGIGPNGFPLGPWREAMVPRWHSRDQPSRLQHIPENLRRRLPLGKIDHSTVEHYCPLTIYLSQKDILRWQLAGIALQKEVAAQKLPMPQDDSFIDFSNAGGTSQGAYFVTGPSYLLGWTRPFADDILEAALGSPGSNQQRAVLFRVLCDRLLETEVLKLGSAAIVLMLPGLLYGGLHLALWDYSFPSNIERILWRISSITLLGIPTLGCFSLGLRALRLRFASSRKDSSRKDSPRTETSKPNTPHSQPSEGENHANTTVSSDHNENPQTSPTTTRTLTFRQILLQDFIVYSGCLVLVFYAFARVYIIVESFISLRHVPKGVYTDVGWSRYIPHL